MCIHICQSQTKSSSATIQLVSGFLHHNIDYIAYDEGFFFFFGPLFTLKMGVRVSPSILCSRGRTGSAGAKFKVAVSYISFELSATLVFFDYQPPKTLTSPAINDLDDHHEKLSTCALTKDNRNLSFFPESCMTLVRNFPILYLDSTSLQSSGDVRVHK